MHMQKNINGIIFQRFANILKITNTSIPTIWKVVKKIKVHLKWDQSCRSDGLYNGKDENIKTLEKELGIVSSQTVFQNLTKSKLKAAAEMYIYLNTCPYSKAYYGANKAWFRSWYNFYKDLFSTQPVDIIILTLNRIMNSKLSQYKDTQEWNERLFNGSSKILSLKYQAIQNMFPGKTETFDDEMLTAVEIG